MKTNMSKIKELLAMRNMTSRELAEKLGVHEVAVSRYIHGKILPSYEVLEKMCQALGVTATDILGF